jgi:hypothetical protein
MNVTRDGPGTPSSASTRTVSALRLDAEPMCSIPSTVRPRLCTIWTAVAPDAVLTRRTNNPTTRGYPVLRRSY